MHRFVFQFWSDESGLSSVEWALIAGLFATFTFNIFKLFGPSQPIS